MGKTNVDDLVSPGGIEAGAADLTEAELEMLDGITPGTALANKAAVLGADKNLDVLAVADLKLGAAAGTSITATAAEINKVAGVTGGTALASKAVVLDANKDVRGIGIGNKVTAAAADGAIAVKTGVVAITKAGVAALTLADPTDVTDDGCELIILAITANAHTVSNAAGSGFNGGGAGGDIGTFGGAIGDNLHLIAYGGKWHIISSVNVTLA